MDGLPQPAALPPIAPGMSPPAPLPYQNAIPQRQQQAPVGRPAQDPEVQEEKIRRTAEVRRIENILPKSVDSKLLIYQLARGQGTLKMNQRPVITLLASELEQAKADGREIDEIIEAKLNEKYPSGAGRVLCKFVDRAGKTLPSFPPFEMGTEEAYEDADRIDDFTDRDLGFHDYQLPPASAPLPPAPAAIDPQVIARVARDERNDEARRGGEMAQMMAQSQQSMMTMLMTMQQQNQAQAEIRSREEAARRSETQQLLLAALPVVLQLFKRDPVAAPTETTSDRLMLELVRAKLTEKPSESPIEKMMEVMAVMSKQQLDMQGAGARAAMEMQASTASMANKFTLETMKDLMSIRQAPAEEKESILEKLLPALPAALAALQGNQAQPAAAQPAYVPPQPQPALAAPARPIRPRRAPGQPPRQPSPARQRTQQQAATMEPIKRVAACLATIQGLSTGQIPATQRPQALTYIVDMATPELRAALVAGNMQEVTNVGSPAVMASASLMQWIGAEHHQAFLTEACTDLKLMLNGTMSRERMEVAIRTTAEFTQKYHDRVQAVTPTAQPAQVTPPPAQIPPGAAIVTEIIQDPPPAAAKPKVVSDGMIGGPVETTPATTTPANTVLTGPGEPGQSTLAPPATEPAPPAGGAPPADAPPAARPAGIGRPRVPRKTPPAPPAAT